MTRSRWSFSAVAFAAAAMLASSIALAQAPKTVKIRVQSVIPTSADEVTMLKEFAADVAALTANTVTFEILPAGALVPVNDTLDAVDKASDVGPALRAAAAAQREGRTTVLEMMVTRELGDPFRRDALSKPVRHLEKYKQFV